MSRRRQICRQIIDELPPDALKEADRLLAKLLKVWDKAQAEGRTKISFSADARALHLIAVYASFGRKPFLEAMQRVLDDNGTLEDSRSFENSLLLEEG